MSKKPLPTRVKARAAERAAAPRPAPTSVQRTLDAQAKDASSARSRSLHRRLALNNNVVEADVPDETLKVMATQTGYYDHARRRAGDVFLIDAAKLEEDVIVTDQATGKTKVSRKKGEIAAFSSKWMEIVDPDTPESVSTANDEIRRQHDELLASRHADGILTGPDNVSEDLEDTGDNPLGE